MNNLEQVNNNNAVERVPYSVIQHNVDTISISSAEVGQLWSTYMAQSMSKCMVPFFVEKCKDTDIRSLLQFVLMFLIDMLTLLPNYLISLIFPSPMVSLMRILM